MPVFFKLILRGAYFYRATPQRTPGINHIINFAA